MSSFIVWQDNADGAANLGYGATAKKENAAGMVVDQLGNQQTSPEYTPGGVNRASMAATKNISNMNRGSEFKKTAQQMLNK